MKKIRFNIVHVFAVIAEYTIYLRAVIAAVEGASQVLAKYGKKVTDEELEEQTETLT